MHSINMYHNAVNQRRIARSMQNANGLRKLLIVVTHYEGRLT